MFLTILGMFVGGSISYVFLKIFNFNFNGSRNGIIPSEGKILVFMAVLIGGCIGFGADLANANMLFLHNK